MTLALFLLVIGFVLLLKGADLFVDGAARMAREVGVAPMTVGLTVVAFGCAVPELFIGIAASVSGDTAIALGDVVGGGIVNGLLVLGVAALMRPLHICRGTVWHAIPFNLLAAVLVWGLASDVVVDNAFFSMISRSDGLALLSFFIVFMAYAAAVAMPPEGLPSVATSTPDRPIGSTVKMVLGFCGLLFGSRWIVDNVVFLADQLAVSPTVMGLTGVALGTSLPELATAAAAARQGHAEIAVGTVIGSNIFNLFFVLGSAAVIQPLPVEPALHIDLGMLTAASVLPFVFLFSGRMWVMGRREGGLAVLLYLLYVGYRLAPVFSPGLAL